MSKASDFVKKGKITLKKSTLKSINDLLDVLDSEIIYPLNRDKSINEARLLAVVKSRGEAYDTAVWLSDEIELDRSTDNNLKNNFINGLKTTFNEMDKVFNRDIRGYVVLDKAKEKDDEEGEEVKGEISDDYIALLSKTKKEAYTLNKKILERISQLDDPEGNSRENLENIKAISITEQYADN